jgi:tetratricopeptide (TPR) repeat protein
MLRKAILASIIILCVVSGCESQSGNKELAQIRWQKASAYAKLNFAEQQYQSEQFEQALKTVSECVTTSPDMPEAHLLFGKLLLAQRQFYRATSELTKAVELDEKLDSGWYWLGVAAEEQENYHSAVANYEKAMSLRPTNVDYILATAEIYSVQDRKNDAIQLFEQKIAEMPKEISLKIAAADFMWQLGEDQQAIELYKQASLLAGDGYTEEIAESLGYCYVFAGRWDEAAEIFTELSERCTQQQNKKLYLQVAALCGINSGGYGTAVNCYNQLAVTERDNPQLWLKLGRAALGAGAADRAFECGRKALKLQPGLAEAIALVGCAQYVGGDYDDAIEDFERIATDNEYGSFSWLMRARCYERLGRVGKAGLAYQKALEMNPNSELGRLLAQDAYKAAPQVIKGGN